MPTGWQEAEDALREEANQYVEWAFRDHDLQRPRDWKIIQDVLSGSSRFEAWEMAIIDTPLVQRLRRIGQTGLSSQLYPSAHSTRFEHALGVAVVTGRIMHALNAQPRLGGDQEPFSTEDCQCARAAALLHDVGHGPFSHCCEYYCFDAFPGLRALVQSDDSPYTHCKPHEVIGAFVVTSPRMSRLFQQLAELFNTRIDPDKVSRMILQLPKPGEDHLAYVYQVVNGPFDADKLDYIRRDSYMTGLQMALELDRLIHSLSKGGNQHDTRPQQVILVGAGGVPAVEQILFSKMLLTSALYHHHKVRAVEAMLEAAFGHIKDTGSDCLGRRISSPIDFLYVDDVHVLSASRDDDVAGSLLRDVLDRRLVKRALVISNEALARTRNATYNHFMFTLMRTPERRAQLRDEICDELRDHGRELSPAERARVFVDFPKPPSFSEPSQTYVLRENGRPQQLDEMFSMENWLEAYRQFFWRGHVFAPSHIRAEVGIAAREVLRRVHGIDLTDIAHDLCKYGSDWRQVRHSLYG